MFERSVSTHFVADCRWRDLVTHLQGWKARVVVDTPADKLGHLGGGPDT